MPTATSSSAAPPTDPAGGPGTAAADAARRRRRLIGFGAAVGSGVALRCAQPGIGWWPLAFVALVPLLLVARTPRRGALFGFVSGFVSFLWLLAWVFRFAWFAWVLLGAWMACSVAVVGAVAGLAWRRPAWLRIPLIASAWVVGEFVWGHWPFGGFAWGQIGVTQYAVGPVRALAALGGVPLISWLLVAVNVAVASVLAAWWPRAGRGKVAVRRDVFGALAALVAVGAVVCGGWALRPSARPSGRLRVGVVQANTFEDGVVDDAQMIEAHLRATAQLPSGLDLVVWGESSLLRADIDPTLARYVMTASRGVPVMANAYVVGSDDRTFANTNVLFTLATATGAPPWEYVKQHRVPFGEYVPFRSLLAPLVPQLDRVPRDALVGASSGVFDLAGRRLGTMICFESVFAEPAAALVRQGATGFVVTTNNSSYGRSDLSRQYVAMSAMRAAEQHRPMVVAAISGRSAVVSPSGAIVASTSLWQDATLVTSLPLQTDRTVFGRFGDVVTPLSVLLLVGGLFLTLRGRNGRVGGGIASERADVEQSA